MPDPTPFNEHILAWSEAQQTPWLRLRYRIVHHNLLRHLPSRALRILDVGGGNGADSIPLATLGHAVTLVDFATSMLADARQHATRAGVLDQVTFVEADVSAIPTQAPAASFDVALCHNVLQYVDDPATVLDDIVTRLRPGGVVSIVVPNRYAEPYLAALLHTDLPLALERLDAHEVTAQLFQVPVRRFTGAELRALLERNGCSGATEYGVLCVCAYIANNELKYDPAFFAQLEQLELALTDRYPYALLGRFVQLIGQAGAQ